MKEELKEIIKKIQENKDKLREFGVRRIGIFGSVVRGEERDERDKCIYF